MNLYVNMSREKKALGNPKNNVIYVYLTGLVIFFHGTYWHIDSSIGTVEGHARAHPKRNVLLVVPLYLNFFKSLTFLNKVKLKKKFKLR